MIENRKMNEESLELQLPHTLDEEERARTFEQYKILVESLNNTNLVRETSNNFWMAVNGIGITGIAYLKEVQTLPYRHKYLILWTLILLGIFLCLAWLNYLATIKRTTQIRNAILVELERYFPVKVFTRVFDLTQRQGGKASLTLREMLVPTIFLLGYLFFAVLLFFFSEEAIQPSKI